MKLYILIYTIKNKSRSINSSISGRWHYIDCTVFSKDLSSLHEIRLEIGKVDLPGRRSKVKEASRGEKESIAETDQKVRQGRR